MTVGKTTLLRPGTGALRPAADDEAASSAPKRFAFRQGANGAQAFGHDAAGGGLQKQQAANSAGSQRTRKAARRLRNGSLCRQWFNPVRLLLFI